MLTGMVEVALPGKRFEGRIWLGDRVTIHPEAVLVGPILIGNNCTVREGARIYGPTVLGDNTVVGKNVVIKRGILWNNVVAEDEAELVDLIVADDCVVPGGILLRNEALEKGKRAPARYA